VGTLDPSGRAEVVFTLPGSTPPELAGTTLHHAYLVLNLVPQRLDLASNAVGLRLDK